MNDMNWRWGRYVPYDEKIEFDAQGEPGGHGFAWTEQFMLFKQEDTQ